MLILIEIILYSIYAFCFVFGQRWLMNYFSVEDDRVIEVALLLVFVITWIFLDKLKKSNKKAMLNKDRSGSHE